MSEKFDPHPFPDRKEHDYNNRAHVLLSRAHLVIKDLTELFEEHSQTLTDRRKTDEENIVTDDVPGGIGADGLCYGREKKC